MPKEYEKEENEEKCGMCGSHKHKSKEHHKHKEHKAKSEALHKAKEKFPKDKEVED